MQKIIVANWKCNPSTLSEAKRLLINYSKIKSAHKIVVCPSFCFLPFVKKSLAIALGAQNCFWENSGSFTGEVSPLMLKSLGVKYIILGHSERFAYLGETADMVAKKTQAVLLAGIQPIICVGENEAEKESGQMFAVIEKELKESFRYVKKSQANKIIIAYEPLWAIGTGRACSANDVLTVILYIKKIIGEMFGRAIGGQATVLYGGSVSVVNGKDYLAEKQIGGLLIGGLSLRTKELLQIVKK